MSQRRPDPASEDAPRPIESALARDLAVLRGEARAPGPERGAAQRRRRRIWIGTALAVLAFGAAAAWRVWSRPPEVTLVTVAWRDVGAPPVLLSASGYLQAHRQITVSSKAQGKIVEMAVAENRRVAKGDLIARLESDEARAQLALAEAEHADAARELKRVESLRGGGASSQAALDRAQTRFEVSRAQRELARVALDNREIRAPIDGTVIRRIRDVGEFLTIGVTAEGDPGTAVVTLADLSAIEVSLDVGESEIRKVELGAVALVTPEAMPRQRYLADVIEIAAMADRQKGVVPVKVRIRTPDRALLPDMSAKVSFLSAEPSGPIQVARAVPASAVVARGDARVVFTVDDNRARAAPIKGRDLGDGFFALDEGPDEGTPLVERPPEWLRDGGVVRLAAAGS
ncbi:MAG: efflux RND transporter periplasmic adaptor subunit [Deltaproteobacteria bacterium]|nr:MAG: efflux RND transporter periplasmic adaptor subunit [Deltaproteobacteria bacterium]